MLVAFFTQNYIGLAKLSHLCDDILALKILLDSRLWRVKVHEPFEAETG